jgi:hypothetical protein
MDLNSSIQKISVKNANAMKGTPFAIQIAQKLKRLVLRKQTTSSFSFGSHQAKINVVAAVAKHIEVLINVT